MSLSVSDSSLFPFWMNLYFWPLQYAFGRNFCKDVGWDYTSLGLFHTCSLVHSLGSPELLLSWEIGNNCFLFSFDSPFIVSSLSYFIFRYINNAIGHCVPKIKHVVKCLPESGPRLLCQLAFCSPLAREVFGCAGVAQDPFCSLFPTKNEVLPSESSLVLSFCMWILEMLLASSAGVSDLEMQPVEQDTGCIWGPHLSALRCSWRWSLCME